MRWIVLVTAFVAAAASAPRPVDYVDTFIGTGGVGFGIGSINPGAQVPFGALRLGPDTSLGLDPLQIPFDHNGGYYYNDDYVRAFSHVHLVGAGVEDWGNFGVMPIRQDPTALLITDNWYHSKAIKSTESSSPGYYTIGLETWNATAETVAAGTHAGMHRYTCHGGAGTTTPCGLLIDMCHSVQSGIKDTCKNASVTVAAGSDANQLIVTGWVLQAGGLSERSNIDGIYVYFYAVLAPEAGSGLTLSSSGTWEAGKLQPGGTGVPFTTSNSLGAYAVYTSSSPSDSQVLTLRVGISFIDVQHAEANYNVQLGGSVAFDDVKVSVSNTWNVLLSRVTIDAATPHNDSVKLYSALYRTFMSPTIYTESNGDYLGFDGAVHSINGTTADAFVSDLSLWDIHRTQIPWLTVVHPAMARDVANSLLRMTEQGGHLPRWPMANIYTGCMTGSHGIVSFSEALLKGVSGVNLTEAYEIVQTDLASQDTQGSYDTLGWVTAESADNAASLTLEYAFDDFVLARMGSVFGDNATYAKYHARSMNYKNAWDASQQLMCARAANGSLQCPALPWLMYPFETTYTEGSGYQWQWYVPHDMIGLAQLYPSLDEYAARLDAFFNQSTTWFLGNAIPGPYYWAGNEPDILAPWQFPAAGEQYASRTQYWTRWLLNNEYTPDPDGIPGNDDYGTMSAWQLWAYFGVYPVAGDSYYVLGSPGLPSANISAPATRSDGRYDVDAPTGRPLLAMVAHDWSPDAVFVSAVHVNGQPYASSYIQHAVLFAHPAGNVLEFFMTSDESKARGKRTAGGLAVEM